jgi:threonine synthase
VNVNMRAYYSEGSKTIALETAEQLGWRAPDRVVAPIASGSLYTKILQGFEQGAAAGLIHGEVRPAMHGAQGAGCAPVAEAFATGADAVVPVRPTGVAKSLAIGNPADGVYALGVARRSGGSIEAAADDEIVDGIRLLARTTGIFTETAGGVTTAVLRRLAERGEIGAGETVVLYITGDGLKTVDAVASAVETVAIPADADAVDAALGEPVCP